MTNEEAIDRVRAMVASGQQTWDLSAKDELALTMMLAENARLRAELKKVVHAHGGTHGEDCHAYGANDDDVEPDGDGESPDPWCDCGALKIRNAARDLLASHDPNGGTK